MVTVASAIVGGFVTWLVARRQRSGRVDTTEAHDLWAESQTMRQELRAEISTLRTRLNEVEAELTETKSKLSESEYTAALLRNEVRELRSALGVTSLDVLALRRDMSTARSLSEHIEHQREERDGP